MSGADLYASTEDRLPSHRSGQRRIPCAVVAGVWTLTTPPVWFARSRAGGASMGCAMCSASSSLATGRDALMLPKIKDADEIRWLDELLTSKSVDLSLQVIIETADGLENEQLKSPALRREWWLCSLERSISLRSYAAARTGKAWCMPDRGSYTPPRGRESTRSTSRFSTWKPRRPAAGSAAQPAARVHRQSRHPPRATWSDPPGLFPMAAEVDRARRILARFAEVKMGWWSSTAS